LNGLGCFYSFFPRGGRAAHALFRSGSAPAWSSMRWAVPQTARVIAAGTRPHAAHCVAQLELASPEEFSRLFG